jgi:hypothetical protein
MIARMIATSEPGLESAVVKGDIRAQLPRIADALAAAVAVSLPWSTSATGILIVLWLIAAIPNLDRATRMRELATAAGGLPVLFWTLGALGMLWADVSWSERLAGLNAFHKLLLIPLLMAHYRRGGNAWWAILGFLVSSGALLVVSWALVLTPGLEWRGDRNFGVPVKDYIFQSEIFAICVFGLIGQAAALWRERRRSLALALMLVAALFASNIAYVATSRTTLIVAAALVLLFGLRLFGWRGGLAAVLVGGMVAGIVWVSSPYLRERVAQAIEDVRSYDPSHIDTSAGLRFEYWSKSLTFVAEAPVIGHGTGTIAKLFERAATPETIPTAITTNPHNQVLAVALQLGVVGVLALIAMWIAHLALLSGRTLLAWFGLVVVVDNVISSFFNSHLFDFAQGWLYVLGVGIIGGAVLRGSSTAAASEGKP